MLEKFKKYYEDNLWSEERLRNLVRLGKITEEEFEEIINEE